MLSAGLFAMPMFLSVGPPPDWSGNLVLGRAPLKISVRRSRDGGPTTLEVRSKGGRVLCTGKDETYFDLKTTPRLWKRGTEAVLVFVEYHGAGTGEAGSMWRIWDSGRRIQPMHQEFLYGDFRRWRNEGIVRESRPAKYATEDIVKAFPRIFDDEIYRDKWFVSTYRYDRKATRFRLLSVKMRSAPTPKTWPTVRF